MHKKYYTVPIPAAWHFPGRMDCFGFIPGEVLGFNAAKSPMTKLKEAENQHPSKNKSPQRHRELAFPIKQKRIWLPRSDDTVGQQHVIECLWCVYCWKGEKSHEHGVIVPLCFLWICANLAVLYPEAKQAVKRFSPFLPRQERISKCDTEKPERVQYLYTPQLGKLAVQQLLDGKCREQCREEWQKFWKQQFGKVPAIIRSKIWILSKL